MDDLGPRALPFARGGRHPRGMGARRRAGPAALAAALLGAGLLLYRPRLVPELRAGSRGEKPPPAAALAWPAAAGIESAAAGSGGDSPDASMIPADEIASWRDALADRPFSAVERGAPAPRASSASARRDREPRESPSAAEAESVQADVVRRMLAASRREHRAPALPRPSPPDGTSLQDARRRMPLALGPAGPDEGDGADDGGTGAVDSRRSAGRPDAASWTRRRARFFPLFRPPHRETRPPKRAAARRRVRPLLLSKQLGRGALRPPPSSIVPPDLSSLKGRKPLLLPDGTPAPSRVYELDRIEASDPRRAGAACRRRARHWDDGLVWHDGSARGLIEDARWLWLWKEKTRWWAVREPEDAPLLRHQGRWWSKQRGVWFALHDGELWSWRRFADWDAEGLIRLADGVELVYSADFTKVAVITPGAGAVLYDAYGGVELGEWLESELPRRRPRAPSGLRLPRGI